MVRDDLLNQLDELDMVAWMNQLYHQVLVARWAWWDRAIKVLVLVVSIAGLICSILNCYGPSVALAIVSVLVAWLLNVIPLGDWSREHYDLFRRWTDLRKDADELKLATERSTAERALPDHLANRWVSIVNRRHGIEADQPAPDRKLLFEKQCDIFQALWGTRDPEEAQRKAAAARAVAPSSATDRGAQDLES